MSSERLEESGTCCSRSFLKLEHGQHPVVTFGEPVVPSDNPTWVVLGKQDWR